MRTWHLVSALETHASTTHVPTFCHRTEVIASACSSCVLHARHVCCMPCVGVQDGGGLQAYADQVTITDTAFEVRSVHTHTHIHPYLHALTLCVPVLFLELCVCVYVYVCTGQLSWPFKQATSDHAARIRRGCQSHNQQGSRPLRASQPASTGRLQDSTLQLPKQRGLPGVFVLLVRIQSHLSADCTNDISKRGLPGAMATLACNQATQVQLYRVDLGLQPHACVCVCVCMCACVCVCVCVCSGPHPTRSMTHNRRSQARVPCVSPCLASHQSVWTALCLRLVRERTGCTGCVYTVRQTHTYIHIHTHIQPAHRPHRRMRLRKDTGPDAWSGDSAWCLCCSRALSAV